jgi:hypothetical protein
MRARVRSMANDLWVGGGVRLNASEQGQDDQHEDDGAHAAAGIISPAAAVRPGRQDADEHEDEQDQDDGADGHVRFLEKVGSPPRGRNGAGGGEPGGYSVLATSATVIWFFTEVTP